MINTKLSIRELVMDAGPDVGLDPSAFELLPRELQNAKICIRNLVKLRLTLSMPCSYRGDDSYLVHHDVPKIFGGAISLERLALKVEDGTLLLDPPATSALQVILGGCRFSELRTLVLDSFNSNQTELLGLLQGSPKLQELALDGHELEFGTWDYIANEIGATLPLREVTFHRIRGCFRQPRRNWVFLDEFGDARRFFFENGNNPFTEKEFGRYRLDKVEPLFGPIIEI